MRAGSGARAAETYKVGAIRIHTNKSATDFFAKFNGGTHSDNEVIIGFPAEAEE